MTAFQLRPIISSLKRHKLTSSVLVLQVALTFAVICNVAYMLVLRGEQVSISSGVDEARLSLVKVSDLVPGRNAAAQHETDLAALRSIPGVESAVAVDALPFNGFDINLQTCVSPEGLGSAAETQVRCLQASIFDGTQGTLAALGLQLIAGRNFSPQELVPVGPGQVIPDAHSVIVSSTYAQHLFGGNAVGKSVFLKVPGRKDPLELRVVGVVRNLLRPQLRNPGVNEDTILISGLPGSPIVTYVMRTSAERRDTVARQAAEALLRVDPNRVIPDEAVTTFERMRDDYFQGDVTMMRLLVASALALFCVTAIGIAGLANFWVQQRRRTIGIRRAIGATPADILRYFLLENVVIVGAGVIVGAVASWQLNNALILNYEFTRLPWVYYVGSTIVLFILGQLAALGPAFRASAVPPIVAVRQSP
jgi:putative ABC transport system permease protein